MLVLSAQLMTTFSFMGIVLVENDRNIMFQKISPTVVQVRTKLCLCFGGECLKGY